jgi:hypothetical protein
MATLASRTITAGNLLTIGAARCRANIGRVVTRTRTPKVAPLFRCPQVQCPPTTSRPRALMPDTDQRMKSDEAKSILPKHWTAKSAAPSPSTSPLTVVN